MPVPKIVQAIPTIEGAGVRLRRAIGFGSPDEYDPFLLLDDFRSDDPDDYLAGFPWHPHRGMETITYVLRGTVEHRDSLGNSGTIGPGDIQWMTAGRGIIHQEMPKGDASGAMHGFQLWGNLPRASKMGAPSYRGITSGEVPEVIVDGARIKVIAGTVSGVTGPVRGIVTFPEYLDVTLPAGKHFRHLPPSGQSAFAYVIEGAAILPGVAEPVGNEHVVRFGDHTEISFEAGAEPVRFLLVSGRPIREPIAWSGPIVMNTDDELREAFDELDKGTFLQAGR